MPAPVPPNAPGNGDTSHQDLLDKLDLALTSKPFRSAAWKPSQRRNKNVKQIISDAQRREVALTSALPTQNNSGSSTPVPHQQQQQSTQASAVISGASTPTVHASTGHSISQAAHNLSTMVLEKNLQASLSRNGTFLPLPAPAAAPTAGGMQATYTNIESAPSLHPASQKHYCDITGLPAAYMDPKSRLRYYNKEVFDLIRGLPQGAAERYLEARAAHVILK